MRKRKIAAVAGVLGLSISLICSLQFAFLRVGQEFGAYGQYHRVLRVAKSMDDYAVIGHGVRRELKFGHLSHVEEFSLKLRDKGGQIGRILFKKDTEGMSQKDEKLLRAIIREKFRQAVAGNA